MFNKTYIVYWQTVEGRNQLTMFMPSNDSRVTTSYARRCRNPRESARNYVGLLSRNNLKITRILSGYNIGILT